MTGLHSPTLTNPDMILPYGSPSSAPTSPTTRSFHNSSTRPEGSNSLSSEDDGEGTMRRGVRRLFSNGFGSQRKASITAIQIDEGSNRSMIHEETKLTPHNGHDELLLASSPTVRDRHDYKSSSDGGSDDLSIDHWEGFDGPIIETVVETHHDDDQESLNGHQESHNGASTPERNEPGLRSILDEDEDDPNSHAAMSKRAELILANAKKRLLTMENNLHRARSGLNGRPSSSMSSFSSHNHEPVSLYTIPGKQRSPDGTSPSKHRQGDTFLPSGGSKGHLRIFSESAVPSSLHTNSVASKPQNGDIQQSSGSKATDIDTDQVDSAEEQGSGTSRNWFWTGLNRNGGSAGRLNNSLEPLQEDEPAPASFGSPSQGSSPHSMEYRDPNINSDHPPSEKPSFDHENTLNPGLVRKRSTNQMRELRDQMQDLRGKISTLKQRAREDSMKRRSLQSLRTPSPFTAAEQWYSGSPGHQLGNTTIIATNVEQKRSMSLGRKKVNDFNVEPVSLLNIEKIHGPQNKAGVLVKDYKVYSELQGDTSIDTSIETSTNSRSSVHEVTSDESKNPGKPNSNIQMLEDDCSELSGDSHVDEFSSEGQGFANSNGAQEFKESTDNQGLEQSSSPIGERHEDRPDAFDYEHFYLHSAMGHYSRRKAASPASSISSVYSVETAKPYNDVVEELSESDDEDFNLAGKENGIKSSSRPRFHLRQSSGQSVSTNATFATATEGGGDEETAELPMAGSWQPDNPPQRKFRINTSDASPGTDEVITPTQSSTNMAAHKRQGSRSILDLLSALPAFAPSTNGAPITALRLGDGDTELVDRLIQSLSKVCTQLHVADAEGSGKYEGRQWRRRLDAARRVLEGETNGEAF